MAEVIIITPFGQQIKQSYVPGPTPPSEYLIAVSITGGTYSAPSTIAVGATETVGISASSGYALPSTVTVNGVTGTSGSTGVQWNYSSTFGVITLSRPTDNVVISVTCPSTQPQLDTPTNLSVTDTTASFDEVENAESYEFFVDDVSIGEYAPVSLISFSIVSMTYQAEEGMTWAEWVASEYNTGGFYVDDNEIRNSGGNFTIVGNNYVVELPTNVIQENYAYGLSGGGND